MSAPRGQGPSDGVAVATRGLGKRYGGHLALDAVDLSVPVGSVYGLVGPNGAGKTTLLSILTGLRRATSGTVSLGVERSRVAVVPDTPAFEPWLTAAEVLELARHLTDPALPRSRVGEALAVAGLADAADRRTGGFSRGMLQRLGLATAMVGEPRLLVLDEPSSALDPAGRREVLDLVAGLRGRATVLFSSHILGDVQQVCDTVGILRGGRLVFQGRIEDLLVGRAGPSWTVRVRDGGARLAELLAAAPWVVEAVAAGDDRVEVSAISVEAGERALPAALAAAEVRAVSVNPRTPDLEAVFLELTGTGQPLHGAQGPQADGRPA